MDQKHPRVIKISGIIVVVALGIWLILNVVSSVFDKTLWDALKALAIPLTVGVAVPWLNWLQKKRELDVEHQRAQDEALQAYLDQMSQLLTNKEPTLRDAQPGDHLSAVARARTLTVLPRLDGVGKGIVLRFLYESGLISKGDHVVPLEQADFSGTYLSDLSDIYEQSYLHAVIKGFRSGSPFQSFRRSLDDMLRPLYLNRIDLSNADLSGVNLSGAYLDLANLTGTVSSGAYLPDVHLRRANMSKVTLTGAYIARADLKGAALEEADISDLQIPIQWQGVDFREANLEGAKGLDKWTQDLSRFPQGIIIRYAFTESIFDLVQKAFVSSVRMSRVPRKGIMPNGQKYEDWLKSKDRGEDGQNGGSP